MNNKFDLVHYVYEHWRPDKDVCFYVGKGSGRRANNLRNERSKHHLNIQAKLAHLGMCVEVRLVAEGMTHDDAIAYEIERIAFWKSVGVKLVNLTPGGEGTVGVKRSLEARQKQSLLMKGVPKTKEHRAKISAAKKGKPVPNLRKKRAPRTDIHRENLSKALKGRKGWCEGGGKFSEETLKKMSESGKRRIARDGAPNQKPVVCLQDAKVFESGCAAARFYGVCSSEISMVCNGKSKTVGGMVFKFHENL